MVDALHNSCSLHEEGSDSLTDGELVARCQKELPGDHRAFQELLRRYEGLIFNTCNKLLGSRQDAEEITQDSLVQVYHKIHQFEGRAAFRTWLCKIVHNYCRSRLSKIIWKREGHKAYEQHAMNTLPDHEQARQRHHVSARVEDALRKLEERDREMVVLTFLSGITHQEIADVHDIGLNAAKIRLYRAVEEFKAAYLRLERDAPVPFRTG